MSEFTCEKCKYHKTHQEDKHEYCSKILLDIEHCKPCSFYATKDGKRPRFCRLASSVDEMAEIMVHHLPLWRQWVFWKRENASDFYRTKADALAAAKAWLMEVEE